MKFFRDLVITFVGLALLLSTAVTLFAIIGYFFGEASGADVLWLLKFTVPIIAISLVIAWWNRNVFTAVLGWLFPSF